MGRLIEAEKIREAIINYGTIHIENGVMQLDTVDTVVEIARLVDQIPTAETKKKVFRSCRSS